ncbi:hypothetical protein EM6_1019 [Asticcacaulis excentricus]|uniref:DUF2336 domain-containing protein n=1 Tax=Asticcacaulis excentricus TaxID=78587 RepID=A0A3G9G3J6_9CAUL|nr:hypothetical protein EM6_1019 [Asticcacaulis excentricus]
MHLMQLNALARRQAGLADESQPGFVARLKALIADLPADSAQAVLNELAEADWADPDLVASLCRLSQAGAAGLLGSPVLRDHDLLSLLADSADRARLIARRSHLSPAVIDALIAVADTATATALLNNRHLRLNAVAFDALTDRARTDIALRAPLTRHPRLTREAAARLLDVVGPDLRATLLGRFEGLYARHFHTTPPADAAQTLHRLQGGDFLAFRQGLSRLTGLDRAVVDRALTQDSAVPLVLLLSAAKIDRAAFADILAQVQALNDGHPRIHERHLAFVRGLFDLDADEARQRLLAIYSH